MYIAEFTNVSFQSQRDYGSRMLVNKPSRWLQVAKGPQNISLVLALNLSKKFNLKFDRNNKIGPEGVNYLQKSLSLMTKLEKFDLFIG